jgi:hypothetical protein
MPTKLAEASAPDRSGQTVATGGRSVAVARASVGLGAFESWNAVGMGRV